MSQPSAPSSSSHPVRGVGILLFLAIYKKEQFTMILKEQPFYFYKTKHMQVTGKCVARNQGHRKKEKLEFQIIFRLNYYIDSFANSFLKSMQSLGEAVLHSLQLCGRARSNAHACQLAWYSELQRCASRCGDGLFVSINKLALFYFQPLIYLHLPHWKLCDPAQNNGWEISKTASLSCIDWPIQLISSLKLASTHSSSNKLMQLHICCFAEGIYCGGSISVTGPISHPLKAACVAICLFAPK